MLDKLGGIYGPKPSPGPHKQRECLPLVLLLRNRLKLALTYKEAKNILMQRQLKVDGKVRTDVKFPTGFMDTIAIEKTNQYFRLLFDVKGRFVLHRITAPEANVKLCRVRQVATGAKGIPHIVTHDGRTIRYPHPDIKVYDTVKVNIVANKVVGHCKFDSGNICMITGGKNVGRVGIIQHREKHQGAFDIVHVKDSIGHSFATRISNVFIIGTGHSPAVSLPKSKGVRLSIIEEYARRHKH